MFWGAWDSLKALRRIHTAFFGQKGHQDVQAPKKWRVSWTEKKPAKFWGWAFPIQKSVYIQLIQVRIPPYAWNVWWCFFGYTKVPGPCVSFFSMNFSNQNLVPKSARMKPISSKFIGFVVFWYLEINIKKSSSEMMILKWCWIILSPRNCNPSCFGAHHPHLVAILCWSFSREHSSSSAHECSSLSTVQTRHIILKIVTPIFQFHKYLGKWWSTSRPYIFLPGVLGNQKYIGNWKIKVRLI